jgi:hypothetical protein
VIDLDIWTVGLQAMPFTQCFSHTTTQGLASGAAYCQHWLVRMEQLVFDKGHLPRRGKLICQDRHPLRMFRWRQRMHDLESLCGRTVLSVEY